MNKRYKVVVYVPETHTAKVRSALGKAGAGIIGDYTCCMFTVRGISQFRPVAGSNPAKGKVGQLEEVSEDRIETVCTADKLKNVLKAIRKAHPYEQPATDVYPIEIVLDN